ncbi:hypothetical protein HpNP133_00100 [Helicobacter pylori]
MRNYVGAGPFILIVKNTQRHQFDYQHSIKNFYRLYNALECLKIMINSINRCISKIFAQQDLKLTAKKLKSLNLKILKK